MKPTDKPEFVKIVVSLAAMKPGKPLTGDSIELFWMAMQAWSIEEFRAASVKLASSVEFMPNPYHYEQLRKAAGPQPAEIWQRIVSMISMSEECRRHELLAHPLPVAAVRVIAAMGGWRALEMAETATRHFRERRFCELWQELEASEGAMDVLPALAGRSAPTSLPVRFCDNEERLKRAGRQ